MNILSFSLYGDDPKYVRGMLANCALARQVYPGWSVWVYTEKGHHAVPALLQAGAQVWMMPKRPGHELMFARFLAAGHPDAEAVCFRDADSRLSAREKAAVDEWLASDKKFHVMRDHPHHAEWRVLGGMWGVRGGVLPDIHEQINRWPRRTEKLDDMKFLAEQIWPLAVRDMIHHSSVPTPHPDARPFPAHEPVEGHVGAIVETK